MPGMLKAIVSEPANAFACSIAARSVHVPSAVRQIPLVRSASDSSPVLSTVNVAAEAAPPANPIARAKGAIRNQPRGGVIIVLLSCWLQGESYSPTRQLPTTDYRLPTHF